MERKPLIISLHDDEENLSFTDTNKVNYDFSLGLTLFLLIFLAVFGAGLTYLFLLPPSPDHSIASCSFVYGNDYLDVGGEISPIYGNVESKEHCCRLCHELTSFLCVVSVFHAETKSCFFKRTNANPVPILPSDPNYHNIVACLTFKPRNFSVNILQRDASPRLGWQLGNSRFGQPFNPTFVQSPTYGYNGSKGLIIRAQNCTPTNECFYCSPLESPSRLAFSKLNADGDLSPMSYEDLVFIPSDSEDIFGIEDPRMIYDPVTRLYYMFYTAVGNLTKPFSVFMSLATASNPLDPDSWIRRGFVFPDQSDSKSGALWPRYEHLDTPWPHVLLYGAGNISLATSMDLLNYENQHVWLRTREEMFDSQLVESGPPPLPLSDPNSQAQLFVYNSANKSFGYHAGYTIIDKNNPNIVYSRSSSPFMSPVFDWETGVPPAMCNVPEVVFIEAMEALGNDSFRIWYGGADAVIASAIIQVVENTIK